MPRVDPRTLFAWLEDLQGKTYIYLTEPSLQHTVFLRHLKLDDRLLRAAASYWDPQSHVFRFGQVEMSPLFEEFSAIMGISTDTEVAPLVPSPRPGYVQQLSKLLHVSIPTAAGLISNGELNVSQIADHFHHLPKMWCDGYQEALLLCLACHFIFSSRSQAVIPLVPAMLKDRLNPMAICLAETLMGLDEARAQGTTLLRGSPYILQIWLWERFRIVERNPRSYHQRFYHHLRTVRVSFRSFTDWKQWLSEQSHSDICWLPDLWTHESVVVRLPDRIGVSLYGLHATTFSVPRRVAHQFGHTSETEALPRPHQLTSTITAKNAKIFTNKWPSRVSVPVCREASTSSPRV